MFADEIQLYKDQIRGLKNSISSLREIEKIHIRNQTLQESIAKATVASDVLEESLELVKTQKTELRDRRAEILKSALDPLAQAITALLPRGEAVLSLDDHLFLGWKDGEHLRPYGGLSGGEKVFFDGALSSAMMQGAGQKILILEGGELDSGNLRNVLLKISQANPEAQVLVNSWFPLDRAEVPENWKVVQL